MLVFGSIVVSMVLALEWTLIRKTRSAARLQAQKKTASVREHWLIQRSSEGAYREQAMSRDESLLHALAKVLSHKPQLQLFELSLEKALPPILKAIFVVGLIGVGISFGNNSFPVFMNQELVRTGLIVPCVLGAFAFFARTIALDRWTHIQKGIEQIETGMTFRNFESESMQKQITELNRAAQQMVWHPAMVSWGFLLTLSLWYAGLCLVGNAHKLSAIPWGVALLSALPFIRQTKSWFDCRRDARALENEIENALRIHDPEDELMDARLPHGSAAGTHQTNGIQEGEQSARLR